jgi:hypothetical protein
MGKSPIAKCEDWLPVEVTSSSGIPSESQSVRQSLTKHLGEIMASDRRLDEILRKLEKMEKQGAKDQAMSLVGLLWSFCVAVLGLWFSNKIAVNFYMCIAFGILAVIYTFRASKIKVPK